MPARRHAPGRHLIDDAMIEQNDAIRDVFFETVARQRARAPFSRDHAGDAAVLKPAKQAAQFGAQHGFVGQGGK